MTIAVISMIRDSWGGSETLWYHMAKEALSKGYTVIHLRYETPQIHPKLQELINLGLIAYTRPGWIPENANNISRFLHLGYNYIRKQVKNPFEKVFHHKPDVVLYNGTCYSIAKEESLMKYIHKGSSIKFFILGLLNNDLSRTITNRDAALIRKAYRACQNVFFVSEKNLQSACRHLACDIPNAQVIRSSINITDTSPIAFPSTDEGVNFALFGNLVTIHKGQDIMLQVFGSESWRHRSWSLNIYGDGPDKTYLKNLVEYLHIEDRVVFHGAVSDIRKVWEQNHVLLMPSLMEGMPLVIVEAMLCGRICVATDIGGNSEWLEHEESGFIAEAPTVISLSKAMELSWNQRSAWVQIGQRAHERAALLYDPNAGTTLLKKLVNE